MSVQTRLANMNDLHEIKALLKGIAEWLKASEIDQWSYILTNRVDAKIEAGIQKNETYVLEKDDQIVATFSVSTTQSDWDQGLWGELHDRSLYIHRLAVRLDHKGSGLGAEALKWLEANFADQVDYLKLDCVAHNQKLNQFYQHYGFTFVGETNGYHKYEKKLK